MTASIKSGKHIAFFSSLERVEMLPVYCRVQLQMLIGSAMSLPEMVAGYLKDYLLARMTLLHCKPPSW